MKAEGTEEAPTCFFSKKDIFVYSLSISYDLKYRTRTRQTLEYWTQHSGSRLLLKNDGRATS
jgi:hypothetical protein